MMLNTSSLTVYAYGPSLQEVLLAIEGFTDCSPERKAKLSAFVRKAMHMQAQVAGSDHGPIRFTCQALNATLWRRAPACFGFKSKGSFNNMISGCRDVLTRMGLNDRKAELTPAWEVLYGLLCSDGQTGLSERQKGLIGFMRYCSAHGVDPDQVTGSHLDGFQAWATSRQLKADIAKLARCTASNWNWAKTNRPGWPQVELVRQDMRDHYTLPLEAYPASFQADATAFLTQLGTDPRAQMFTKGAFASSGAGSRSRHRASRPRTIQGHADYIRAAGAALVGTGTPIDQILSLRDLVVPLKQAETIVQFHFQRRQKREELQEHPSRPTHLLGITETLRQIAKFHCGLPDADVAEIAGWKATIAPPSQVTMTDKNMARVRALLDDEVYARLLHLPNRLLRRAQDLWKIAQEKTPDRVVPPPAASARLVMFAVAVEILLACPLRRHNLIQMNLVKDFVRHEPSGKIVRLLIRAGETKNGEMFEWGVADSAADLIALWSKVYRPVLAEEGNPYLFPGMKQAARNEAEFGAYLSDLVESEVGAEFNMHLARHFSVVRYLRANPGQYAVVSRLLGHKKIETTIRFYAGFETNAAAQHVNKVLEADRERTKLTAATAYGVRRKPRSKGVS